MNWHLFFDLDRTLWHHERNAEEVLKEFCEEFILLKGVSPRTFAQKYQEINDALWSVIQSAGYSVDYVRKRRFPQLLEAVISSASAQEKRELAGTLERAFTGRTPDRAHHYPGMIPALQSLHEAGYVLHILTNGVSDSQARKVAALGVTSMFSTLTTSDEAQAYKPDRAIFRYALRRALCAPEQSVMIGDSILRDIRGGREAGMKTLWFQASDALPPDAEGTADGQFSDYGHLASALEAIGCGPGDRPTFLASGKAE